MPNTIELPILTPSSLRGLREAFAAETYAALEGLVERAVRDHVRPYLGNGSLAPSAACRLAIARYGPLRFEALHILLSAVEDGDLEALLRGGSTWARALVDAEGWRLGESRKALVEGVSAYSDLVDWTLRHMNHLQSGDVSLQLGEQLLHAATTTEFCMTAALLTIDGTIELSTVDRDRLDHACRTIACSVSRTREIVAEWVSGHGTGEHPLASLAGSWGDHEDDGDVLHDIYTSRALDAE